MDRSLPWDYTCWVVHCRRCGRTLGRLCAHTRTRASVLISLGAYHKEQALRSRPRVPPSTDLWADCQASPHPPFLRSSEATVCQRPLRGPERLESLLSSLELVTSRRTKPGGGVASLMIWRNIVRVAPVCMAPTSSCPEAPGGTAEEAVLRGSL